MKIWMLLAVFAYPLTVGADVPDGWHLAGSTPQDYEVGVISTAKTKSAAYLKSSVDQPGGFGTLMQTFSAADRRGQRLRLSGTIKPSGVENWAGLWMRIDGADKKTLGFDNMQDRPISGSTEWTRYNVVLDVPEQSEAIAFGVLFWVGAGEVHMDDLRFEEVGKDTALTRSEKSLPSKPSNLTFEN